MGDLGHPDKKVWTEQDWRKARVNLDALISYAERSPNQYDEVAKIWPYHRLDSGKTELAPKPVALPNANQLTGDDKWPADACKFCTNRLYKDGKHYPFACGEFKLFLCKGSDGRKPEVSPESAKFFKTCVRILQGGHYPPQRKQQ